MNLRLPSQSVFGKSVLGRAKPPAEPKLPTIFMARLGGTPRPAIFKTRSQRKSSATGAVLLEVVLALVLFVVAASFITAGMNSSVDTVERLRLNTHAVNLASSILAELQMGARSTETNGPAKFDPPFDKWSWELQYETVQGEVGDTNPLTRVEVIIRHSEQPVVYRLTQILRLEENKKGANATLTF